MAGNGIVPPHIEEADRHAILALERGEASPEQQRRAMQWLGIEACRLMQDPHSEVKAAGGDHDDLMFALGRRYVGILMREMHLPRVADIASRNTAARRKSDAPAKNPTLAQRRATRGK